MSFETLYLRLEKADAHRIISSKVEGLRSKRVDDSIEYQGNDGMLLAVLSDIDSDDGRESKLRYQTSVITPPLAHGRTKAREIRDAVAEYKESR
ncbi:hypothetical protein [Halomicrococcus sp. SG-WS-1]|uniref:hypothetical protein n=1 Tax=Halomicrococcus sp. SG-WS-1 TaxID=3439057 RepID=UPI003F7B282D